MYSSLPFWKTWSVYLWVTKQVKFFSVEHRLKEMFSKEALTLTLTLSEDTGLNTGAKRSIVFGFRTLKFLYIIPIILLSIANETDNHSLAFTVQSKIPTLFRSASSTTSCSGNTKK